jgi:origin recognition complex subunit 1
VAFLFIMSSAFGHASFWRKVSLTGLSMAKLTNPRTPTRRSTRGQPLVAVSALTSASDATWCGDPIYVRPTVREDLLSGELDEWDKVQGGDESGDESGADDEDVEDDRHDIGERCMETVFYASFKKGQKARPMRVPRNTRRKGRSKAPLDEVENDDSEDAKEFKVGDTVLVKTERICAVPSIGVIVAMWGTRCTGDDEDEKRGQKMKVKVHWFLRPNELPACRARRDHIEVSLMPSHLL